MTLYSRFGARHRRAARALAVLTLGGAVACSPSDMVDVDPPSGIIAPDRVKTRAGAMALYAGTVGEFAMMFNGGAYDPTANYVIASGAFTDEFTASRYFSLRPEIDSRNVSGSPAAEQFVGGGLFDLLLYVRTMAQLARQSLSAYASDAPTAAAHAGALEGMTELFAAELYCSGVPLSRVPLDGEFEYASGSTTDEIFTHAIARFDTSIALADSADVLALARVGKARALLGLGRFAEAAQAVAAVPTAFQYAAQHAAASNTQANLLGRNATVVNVPERKGTNGMPWVSAADPRVVVQNTGIAVSQRKYQSGSAPTPVATGVEARLIEAESDLRAGGTAWLGIMNTLRTTSTTCTVKTTPCTAPAGTGGVAGLPLLTDPALDPLPPGKTAADVRVDLVFRERAFWLFATGHRAGDLRRLARHYQRVPDTVYPTGTFTSPWVLGTRFFGTDVVLPGSRVERQNNPRYAGCFNSNP